MPIFANAGSFFATNAPIITNTDMWSTAAADDFAPTVPLPGLPDWLHELWHSLNSWHSGGGNRISALTTPR